MYRISEHYRWVVITGKYKRAVIDAINSIRRSANGRSEANDRRQSSMTSFVLKPFVAA